VTCLSEALSIDDLEFVVQFKYLGILFSSLHGMAMTFPMLKNKVFAAWALLKRQYGRLQCLASVGLMFRVFEACVPPAAAYGCEVWGFQRFPKPFSTSRLDLATAHLQLLKEITGVRAAPQQIFSWQSWGLLHYSMFGYYVQPNFGTTWLASLMALWTVVLHWMVVELLWGPLGAIGRGPCLRPSVLQFMS